METITKHYTMCEGGKAVPSLDLLLKQAGYIDDPSIPEEVCKSAATRVSEYKIFAHTYDSLNSLKLHSFSLNELEVELDIKTKEIRSIILRDTSVHKKISFNKNRGAVLTVVHGQDVVGQNSETRDMATKEPISKLNINGSDIVIPFEMDEVYKILTGVDIDLLTEDDLEDEKFNANLWQELLTQVER